MPHVTEVRSARCKELSDTYARLAATLEQLGAPEAPRFKQLSDDYAQEATDLITGKATKVSCIIAMATCEHGH